ncbi:MAG: type II toxin-antitoxin system RelE/ParE family toxin [Pigmentiphaga sp.]
MKAVAFSPAAEADLGEIWDYTADRWGPGRARLSRA